MNFDQYLAHFESILESTSPLPPYDDAQYMNFVKLNWSRMQRWLKNAEVSKEASIALNNIKGKQKWILITEPWCGDAAHSVPLIALMSQINPNITLEIQLRDTDSEIEKYLTNGGKSIPKLIIRDEQGIDQATWGPRPVACQQIYKESIDSGISHDDLILILQKWYNMDKGVSIQQEIMELVS